MAGENYGFQSTHSLRSATGLSNLLRWRASRFNPRTPCGVRPVGQGWQIADVSVSIHALLAECDARWPGPPIRTAGFNPRTPCGVRQETTRPEVVKLGFQSTHSLRSATCHERKFFPRYAVSIHALLAECDGYIPSIFLCTKRFQSTHSLRSATGTSRQYSEVRSGFNPRTPCGVRPHGPHVVGQPGGFNPRTPCGVRPSMRLFLLRLYPVSIHALLAECDFRSG